MRTRRALPHSEHAAFGLVIGGRAGASPNAGLWISGYPKTGKTASASRSNAEFRQFARTLNGCWAATSWSPSVDE